MFEDLKRAAKENDAKNRKTFIDDMVNIGGLSVQEATIAFDAAESATSEALDKLMNELSTVTPRLRMFALPLALKFVTATAGQLDQITTAAALGGISPMDAANRILNKGSK